jgi:hypothetical protein
LERTAVIHSAIASKVSAFGTERTSMSELHMSGYGHKVVVARLLTVSSGLRPAWERSSKFGILVAYADEIVSVDRT